MLSILVAFTSCHSRKKEVAGKDVPDVVVVKKGKGKIGERRMRILESAKGWLGVPYKYGGNSKEEGTDCSGMVLQVYLEACDIKLPRVSAEQAEFCMDISKEDVMPGDLVFFATGKDPERVSHVGITIDSDNFIHSSTSKGVCISQLSAPYYQRTFIKCGRIKGLRD